MYRAFRDHVRQLASPPDPGWPMFWTLCVITPGEENVTEGGERKDSSGITLCLLKVMRTDATAEQLPGTSKATE